MVRHRGTAEQDLIRSRCSGGVVNPECGAGVSLRIEVDHQTDKPPRANAAERLTTVVFPTPLFWFATTKIRGSAGEGKRNSRPVSREHRLPARRLGRSELVLIEMGPASDQADEGVDQAVLQVERSAWTRW